MLTDEIKQKIIEFASKDGAKESCGVITDDNSVIRCDNIHPNPERYFRISPGFIAEVQSRTRIKAIYHTHPNGNPEFSQADKVASEKTRLPFILLANGLFSIYEPKNYQMPLVGREFLLGSLDCLTLVIDYYQQKLNITIPDIQHPCRYDFNEWVKRQEAGERDEHVLPDFFRKNGFVEVDIPLKNDIILIKSSVIKSPIHCLIYLGNNQVLHHPYNGISEIRGYSAAFKRLKTHIFKHI